MYIIMFHFKILFSDQFLVLETFLCLNDIVKTIFYIYILRNKFTEKKSLKKKNKP